MVGVDGLQVVAESWIAVWKYVGSPQPAVMGFINFLPESFLKRFGCHDEFLRVK